MLNVSALLILSLIIIFQQPLIQGEKNNLIFNLSRRHHNKANPDFSTTVLHTLCRFKKKNKTELKLPVTEGINNDISQMIKYVKPTRPTRESESKYPSS